MIQAVPSITAKMKRNCCWQLRNSFFIDAHEILWSTLECIEADVYIKAAMKKSPLMQVILLANMRIEVAFYQDPSMNGINLKNVCRYCKKNVCKDPDEDYEGFLSSFATLEDAMLSLPMACYYHRLKSVVMFGTKNARQENSSGICCFILYQKKKKNPILITFDFALLTSASSILVLEMINILYVQKQR